MRSYGKKVRSSDGFSKIFRMFRWNGHDNLLVFCLILDFLCEKEAAERT